MNLQKRKNVKHLQNLHSWLTLRCFGSVMVMHVFSIYVLCHRMKTAFRIVQIERLKTLMRFLHCCNNAYKQHGNKKHCAAFKNHGYFYSFIHLFKQYAKDHDSFFCKKKYFFSSFSSIGLSLCLTLLFGLTFTMLFSSWHLFQYLCTNRSFFIFSMFAFLVPLLAHKCIFAIR